MVSTAIDMCFGPVSGLQAVAKRFVGKHQLDDKYVALFTEMLSSQLAAIQATGSRA